MSTDLKAQLDAARSDSRMLNANWEACEAENNRLEDELATMRAMHRRALDLVLELQARLQRPRHCSVCGAYEEPV